MTSLLEKKPNQSIINKRIVIMDDDDFNKNSMKDFIEKNTNYEVELATGIEEVLMFACNGNTAFFILDINMDMGGQKTRRREGILTSTKIREINQEAFIIIYSGNIQNADEEESRADLFVGKNNIRDNCNYMISQIDEYRNNKINIIKDEIREDCDRKVTDWLDNIFSQKNDVHEIKNEIEHLDNCHHLLLDHEKRNDNYFKENINFLEYKKYGENIQWQLENHNYYVAFVDGKLIDDRDLDRSLFLERLRKVNNYKGKSKLVVKIQYDNHDDTIDESTASWLDIL